MLVFLSIVYFITTQTCFCLKNSEDELQTKKTINSILKRLKFAEEQIQKLQQVKSDTGYQNIDVTNELSKRYVTNGKTAVGFTACLSLPKDVKYEGGQTIIFDKVFTNVGQGYNSQSGVFTAPQRGLYVFHLAAMARASSSKWLDIVKDGSTLDSAYVGAHGATDYQSVSKEWALQLDQGSRVWIKDGTFHGDLIDGYCKTAFTGYMVGQM